MLAHGEHLDVLHYHHLVVILVEYCIVNYVWNERTESISKTSRFSLNNNNIEYQINLVNCNCIFYTRTYKYMRYIFKERSLTTYDDGFNLLAIYESSWALSLVPYVAKEMFFNPSGRVILAVIYPILTYLLYRSSSVYIYEQPVGS